MSQTKPEPIQGTARIQVGRIYAAKKPFKLLGGYWDDRQVLWIGGDKIQYDSITVRNGRRYPMVSLAAFEKWAGEDVTDQVPDGDWRRTP